MLSFTYYVHVLHLVGEEKKHLGAYYIVWIWMNCHALG